MRRQLFWGPICEWFSPFWATFKLFSKKVVKNIQQNGADLKSSVLIQDLATKKVAVPQTGFLKEDDLTKTLGIQKSALWDGNFFGARFVSGYRHSGELLNFSLKKWSETYSKTELFKKVCFSLGFGHKKSCRPANGFF